MKEKYLIASSGDTLDSKVSGRFGHSPCFIVADPQTMEFEILPGIGDSEFPDVGKNIIPDVKKVLVGNIGPSTYQEI